MTKEKNEINVLDEINKGACMGQDAIHYILDKVENDDLKKELDIQYNKYKEISEKINNLYPEYSDKNPHETTAMNKIMTFYGIEMKTFNDQSSSKLAELLIQGTNMGIIEGRRILNRKKIDKEVEEIVLKYVEMQEKYLDDLKCYL